MATRECNTCHVPKSLKEFPPNKKCRDGVEPRCKKCKQQRRRDLYAAKTKKAGKANPAAAAPAPARSNGAALAIPASAGLSASFDDGRITLSQAEAVIALLPVQMEQLTAWWKAQDHG